MANILLLAGYGSAGVASAAAVAVATGAVDVKSLNPWADGTIQTPSIEHIAVKPVEEKAPEQADLAIALVAPAFDILRVEPDGSLLIAGRAPGSTRVELLLADGKVLGSGNAGDGGDFVIVLDNPLKPGDYALALRGVAGDKSVLSVETASVRVPEKLAGEVIALVSQPGEASRIITAPLKIELPKEEVAEAQAPVEKVAQEPEPVKVAKVEPAPAKPAPSAKVEPQAEPKPEIVEEKPADKPVKAEANPVEQPAATPKPEVAKVEPKVEEPKVAEAKTTEPAVEPVKGTTRKAEPAVAAKAEIEEPKPAPAKKSSQTVLVEAVEIMNGRLYVAGAVRRGSMVRVYINNKPLGVARGTSDNRFLLQSGYDLQPGTHKVRADLVNGATGAVLARAEVPLVHEPVVLAKPAVREEPAKVEVPVAKTEEQPAPKVAALEKKPDTVSDAVEEPTIELAAAREPEAAPAKAIRTGTSIIIKPGDNLWQISRKTYGSGVRYTTIYNANRDQIRNPSRIYVGQIFKIPEVVTQ